MTSPPVFSMPWDRLDDVDRLMLARDLAAASATWPILAELAAAVRDCAGLDVLTYPAHARDLAEVGTALLAMYEVSRADNAAVRTTLLRVLASWQTFAAGACSR